VDTDLLLIPFDARYGNLRDAALAAEASGFCGVWLWDHLSGTVHRQSHVLECWTTLTALAAQVPRMTVGSLVLNVANRHPDVLAVMASTLQEISGGRLVLGIGAGGGPDTPYGLEQTAAGRSVGADTKRRNDVASVVASIRRTWNTAGYLTPTPPPPIVIGGFGPKMAALAGRVGDGFNTQAGHPDLDRLVGIAREAHAQHGRPAGFRISVFAGLSRAWLEPGGAGRRRLESLGVDRIVLLVSPPFSAETITAAGRLLG
jgi:alkanesulfonate monooxygenase SsuD/methylene tetrahydromethanopterin reductase-like flavin-dependent oxidoreductase (luciferase family)